MNRTIVARTSLLLCLFALPIAACAVEPGDDAESTEAELRRLDASEIVGTIAYGETKTIAYTEEPRYRALSFTAAAGDEIDARFVGAKNLDPIGFLLDSKFKTLVQNDDESSASHASHFTYKITKAGKYYLAVREANEEGCQITIALGKIGGVTPTPPPPEKPTPTPPPGSGHIVHGADRSIALGHYRRNEEIAQWGRGLWEGFVSFDVERSRSAAGSCSLRSSRA